MQQPVRNYPEASAPTHNYTDAAGAIVGWFLLSAIVIGFSWLMIAVVFASEPPVFCVPVVALVIAVIVGLVQHEAYVSSQRIQKPQIQTFIQESTVGEAIVIDRWEEHRHEEASCYWIAYTYTLIDQDGSEQTLTLREDNQSAYKRLKVGDPVSVRYLPNNPQTCLLEDDFQSFIRAKGFIVPDMPRDEAVEP
jgi:hypothetical protein